LRFDGVTEAVWTVKMLVLQMDADGVGFLGRDAGHDEGPIACAPMLSLGSEFSIDAHGVEILDYH